MPQPKEKEYNIINNLKREKSMKKTLIVAAMMALVATDFPMARPHGPQRMDHPRPDAHRGRRDDDQRLAHHHPGTHLDDRHPEGFGRTQ